MKYTIAEFAAVYTACEKGRDWALTHCRDLDDAWTKLKFDWLLWVATRYGVLSERDLRLFACRCARRVLGRVDSPDPRSLAAIEVAERFAEGKATRAELDAAYVAARVAHEDITVGSPSLTACEVAYAASSTCVVCASSAAHDTAYSSVFVAASASRPSRARAWLRSSTAAYNIAWDNAGSVEREVLANDLRQLTPNFER